jgi:hypothetical protein
MGHSPEFIAMAKAMLEKASRNVRANTRDLTAEKQYQRIRAYLESKGLDVDQFGTHDWRRPSFGVSAAGQAQVKGTATQPIAHEAGHMLMTPPGETTASYQTKLNGANDYAIQDETDPRSGYWGNREEYAANAIEHGIMRRAGVSPAATKHPEHGYINHESGTIQSKKLIPEYRGHKPSYQDHYARHIKPEIPRGQAALQAFDEGRHVPQPGGKLGPGSSIDAKINARAAMKKNSIEHDYTHLLPQGVRGMGFGLKASEGPDQTHIQFTGKSGRPIGTTVINHPDIDKISFQHELDPSVGPQHQKIVMDTLARAARFHLYGPQAPVLTKKAEGKISPEWMGRTVLDPVHVDDLEQRAAIHEFQDKMPRSQAEDLAHATYRREHHVQGAAHHLQGMRAAQAAGQMDEATKHGAMYALHLKELGHDPHAEPPTEVRQRAENPDRDKLYRFRAHKADTFLLGKESHLGKGEKLNLDAILAKGDVVPLNPPAPTGKKFRANAEVIDAKPLFQEKRDFDLVANNPEPKAGPLMRDRTLAIGRSKNVYDYSHVLKPEAVQHGHRVEVQHLPGQFDDYMTAHVFHGDTEMASRWAYPTSAMTGGSPNPAKSGQYAHTHPLHQALARALQQHVQTIRYRSAQDRLNAPEAPPEPEPPAPGGNVVPFRRK